MILSNHEVQGISYWKVNISELSSLVGFLLCILIVKGVG